MLLLLPKKANLPNGGRNFIHINIPPLAQRDADVVPLAVFLLKNKLQQRVDTRLLHLLVERKSFACTSELYVFLVNLCFVAAHMGKRELDHVVVNETLLLSDTELLENYVTFAAGSSGLYQLVADYGLRGVGRLLERACISNALATTRNNMTLAGGILRLPTTTLFNKLHMPSR